MLFDRIIKLSTLFAVIFGMFLILSFLKGCFGVNRQQQTAPAINIRVVDSSTNHQNAAPVAAQSTYTGSGQPAIIRGKETRYIIDTAATKQLILEQFAKLSDAFYRENYFRDTARIDSLGYVARIDTVRNNMLAGSSFNYKIKERTILKTITVNNPPPKINQLYLYSGIEVNKDQPFKNVAVSAGLLFRAKNEEMFSAGFSQWPNYGRQYDLKYYHKISFRKK